MLCSMRGGEDFKREVTRCENPALRAQLGPVAPDRPEAVVPTRGPLSPAASSLGGGRAGGALAPWLLRSLVPGWM
jgi:hypothetical protein